MNQSNPGFSWNILKTVKLEKGYLDADSIRNAIEGCGMHVQDRAYDMLSRCEIPIPFELIKVTLVVVKVKEFGFKHGAKLEDILTCAKTSGLELCPAMVCQQLRRLYFEQPKGEWLIIGMEPITTSDGRSRLFCVEHHGGGYWLSSCYDFPDYLWDSDDQFVFVFAGK